MTILLADSSLIFFASIILRCSTDLDENLLSVVADSNSVLFWTLPPFCLLLGMVQRDMYFSAEYLQLLFLQTTAKWSFYGY